jgi:dCTP deaminase
MTVLCDWQIRSYCDQGAMVEPFREELLNPASVDVLLGDNIMIEVADQKELVLMNIAERTAEDPYWMLPNEFCLAETQEIFNLPDFISGQFLLKSSRAREGYQHLLAGFCDPGWNGSKLTLELKNARRHHRLPLYPGLKIGQMVFHRMDSMPHRDYSKTGRYNGDLKVTASKG